MAGNGTVDILFSTGLYASREEVKAAIGASKPTAGQALGDAVAAHRREKRERLAIESMMAIAQEIAVIGEGMAASANASAKVFSQEHADAWARERGLKPELTEGERLARFFATSAHEGHEAVRYVEAGVPRPDDRVWEVNRDSAPCHVHVHYQPGRLALVSVVYAEHRGRSQLVDHDSSFGRLERMGVPPAIVDEVRGTLKAWEAAARAGQ